MHGDYLSKAASSQYIPGAWFCGSGKLLYSLLELLGPEEGYLHVSVICVQGNARQLFVLMDSWECSWQVPAI